MIQALSAGSHKIIYTRVMSLIVKILIQSDLQRVQCEIESDRKGLVTKSFILERCVTYINTFPTNYVLNIYGMSRKLKLFVYVLG